MIKEGTIIYSAIVTKHIGPTDFRGQRVKATTMSAIFGGKPLSATIYFDHELSTARNHQNAAQALLDKLGWTGDWSIGATDTGYVFIKTKATCEVRV